MYKKTIIFICYFEILIIHPSFLWKLNCKLHTNPRLRICLCHYFVWLIKCLTQKVRNPSIRLRGTSYGLGRCMFEDEWIKSNKIHNKHNIAYIKIESRKMIGLCLGYNKDIIIINKGLVTYGLCRMLNSFYFCYLNLVVGEIYITL